MTEQKAVLARSYRTAAVLLAERDPVLARLVAQTGLPKVPPPESLEDTAARVIPYYQRMIEPLLLEGKNILVVAHGNSLRALMIRADGSGHLPSILRTTRRFMRRFLFRLFGRPPMVASHGSSQARG